MNRFYRTWTRPLPCNINEQLVNTKLYYIFLFEFSRKSIVEGRWERFSKRDLSLQNGPPYAQPRGSAPLNSSMEACYTIVDFILVYKRRIFAF